MSDKPISPLRRRMIEDMTVRNFVEKTHNDYIRHVRTFTTFLGRAPDTAAPARRENRCAFDPSFARTCQARYHRALRAGSHQRDPRGHEPVGSAHAADIGEEAAGISHDDHGSSRLGDRGYLPRPWTGLA